jgi:hypothetical protein
MASTSLPRFDGDDWRRIRDALRYQARDLHHRSFAVHRSRRDLLWQEMDRCLALAERIETDLLSEVDPSGPQ